MSGGDNINRVGTVSVHQPQPQSSNEDVHKATSPQRLNRSSIEALPDAQPKLAKSPDKKAKFTPFSSRKITHLLPEKFRLLFSRPKKTVGLQDGNGIREQNKKLSKMFKRQIAKLKKLQKNLQQKLGKNAETAKTKVQQEMKEVKAQATKNLAQSKPVPKRTNNHSKPVSSQLRGKMSWTPEDQALANRLKRLRGEVAHDPITSSGTPKTFDQLNEQLHSISSVEDLKAVVADRRASKITPDQQRRYLGLLNAAVRGMAKNSQYAETMNADLIRDVLKEQPHEAKAAIKQMYDTQADTLQRRLDRLRRS